MPPAGIFLAPARKIRKNRLRGGADRKIYPTSSQIVPAYPDFEPPSPKNPSRPLRGSSELKDRVWRMNGIPYAERELATGRGAQWCDLTGAVRDALSVANRRPAAARQLRAQRSNVETIIDPPQHNCLF